MSRSWGWGWGWGWRTALMVAAACVAAAAWSMHRSPALAQSDTETRSAQGLIEDLGGATTTAPDAAPRALTVAVVVDLRLAPLHTPDGGVGAGRADLDRVLDIARLLADNRDVPLTVAVSFETFDALALADDDASVALLREAVQGRQLLAEPWTRLDVDDWMQAGRADVVRDGMARSSDALAWLGLQASATMLLDAAPTSDSVSLLTEESTGVVAFVVPGPDADRRPASPVTLLAGPDGTGRLTAQRDGAIEALLANPDSELGGRRSLAELARIASEQQADAVIVAVTAHGPAAHGIGSLLEGIDADPALAPATVDEVLATTQPAGRREPAPAGQAPTAGDFGAYLVRRAPTEQRLGAYEALLGEDRAAAAPLRTMLAASANSQLNASERAEYLDAVDEQVASGTRGLDFTERGPITITTRRAGLPVTLVNSRSSDVTVAVELDSEPLGAVTAERLLVRLEPGRNDLTVPIEADMSGSATVEVAVSTPDADGAIVLATGTLRVRHAPTEGLDSLILLAAAAGLALWWLRTAPKSRSATAAGAGATVAASAAGAPVAADRGGHRRPPEPEQQHEEAT